MTKEEIIYVSTVAQIKVLETLLEVNKKGTIEKLLEHLKDKLASLPTIKSKK